VDEAAAEDRLGALLLGHARVGGELGGQALDEDWA
jgi:hypothetical protein